MYRQLLPFQVSMRAGDVKLHTDTQDMSLDGPQI